MEIVRAWLKRQADGTDRDLSSSTSSNRTKRRMIFPSGIKALHNPEESIVDIIFVHGLNGDREDAWTAKGATQPWPQTLLSAQIANARILTFGYDAHVSDCFGLVSKNTIGNHSMNLLSAVATYRENDDTNNRPILFVCHSLGDLVCEDALVEAAQRPEDHLRNILGSTYGILFLGTPHHGSGLAEWAEKLAKSIGVLKQTNCEIVAVLKKDSEVLARIQGGFHAMIRSRCKDSLRPIEITCFYEELPLLGIGVVVPSYSAILPGYVPIGVRRNHMDMTKFDSEDDPGFMAVAGELCRWTKGIALHNGTVYSTAVISQQQQRSIWLPHQTSRKQEMLLEEEHIKMLSDSLCFEQMDARRTTIKAAHTTTCEWLLQNSEYVSWLDDTKTDEQHSFLWIKGNPGTGKSTVMKFAFTYASRVMKDKIIISFFFNARGHAIEKSTIGTYRSLLSQLLQRLPTLKNIFNTLDLSKSSISENYQWSIESLQALLKQAIQSLGESSVVCFIDALDECEDLQIRDMISFFGHINELAASSGIRLKICFSSRHYPHITVQKGLGLVLERQEGHNQDITRYVECELKIGQCSAAQKIRAQLQEKASGIFMWVVLVVGILNKAYDKGRIHLLQQRLQEIPSDLHKLYHNILTRDSDNPEELILCIQWALFSTKPLRPEQMYFGIRYGAETQAPLVWNRHEIPLRDIKIFILDCSKGLVEVTNSNVQFIHESVRDFLLEENGLGNIWPALKSNFRGQSHEQLKRCCIRYISRSISIALPFGENLPTASGRILRRPLAVEHPFLKYAVENVLYHANAAAGSGITQKEFIQDFQRVEWIVLKNWLEKYEVRVLTKHATLLYILAERNLSNLIRGHASILSYAEVEDERYGSPLLAALATGSREAVQVFLEAELVHTTPESPLHNLWIQLSERKGGHCRQWSHFKYLKRRSTVSYLVEHDDELLLAFLLQAGRIGLSREDDISGHTPLFRAAENRNELLVKLLLNTGKIDIDSEDFSYKQTPLSYAAQHGLSAIVKLLLETNEVDVNSRDGVQGQTPLSWAAEMGHVVVVKLLLETGKVAIDIKDNCGLTPLMRAVDCGQEAVVNLLLQTNKVDLGSKDNAGRTPLYWAQLRKHEAIERMLLKVEKSR